MSTLYVRGYIYAPPPPLYPLMEMIIAPECMMILIFSVLFRIQDRAECHKGTELHWVGEPIQKNCILEVGDTLYCQNPNLTSTQRLGLT